ncbi:MAG: methionine--tRNA ligase, partial [Patescibacteria group bacterium]|nr:methionine--tRNA ligase [Patescibacteria group bacterium]
TGTDDHGIKIYRSAQKAKITPKQFVDKNIQIFKKLTKAIQISNNDFISTSDQKKHWAGVQKIWLELKKSGDIYKKKYKGLYCVGCESYILKRDLIDGKCPIHQKEPEVIEEENYFFKLSKYKSIIKEKIESDELKIIPMERKHEVLNVIDHLEDISFSRPKEKLPWGIPVPDDESQVIYVWCDALSNYITALGYGTKNVEKFKKFWPADIHCVGKDILKFHAIFWPAILLSIKFPLPKNIFVHGFITSEGKKMSKSIGNVVDPFELTKKYGVDSLRYYLIREISATGDGDFSQRRFEELYDNELANDLGNLVNRVIVMTNKYDIKLKTQSSKVKTITQNPKIDKLIENLKFDEALKEIWKQNKPWELVRTDPKKLQKVLLELVGMLHAICYMLHVFLPSTSAKIESQLQTLNPEPLFPRIR